MSVPFAPKPSESIDWDSLGANVIDVNGHAECTYNTKTNEWDAPSFVPDPYIRVHGLSPGLNYGQQAVEGLKANRHPDQSINIFRPDKHAARLQHSCSTVSIPPIPTETFLSTLELAISRNGEFVPPHDSNALLYIRPVAFATGPKLIPTSSPAVGFKFVVFVFPVNSYAGSVPRPLDAVVLDEFDRSAPRGAGSAKIGGNYAPLLRFVDAAKEDGFSLVLSLDCVSREEVEEFGISGFVGVEVRKVENENGDGEDGGVVQSEEVTIVAPDSGNVIESVTADSALLLARSIGWRTEKRAIPFSSLSSFNEVMTAGTGSSLVGVKSITRRQEGGDVRIAFVGDEDGQMGPVTRRLAEGLREIQKGLVEDVHGWCYTVRDV